MKKFLRFIGILLLILVVGFLVLCAVSDGEVKVERSTIINAPKAVVWEQVVKYRNWENWNAWKEMDTTIVTDYSGVDGQEGSSYHYVGKRSGEGTQTNMGVTDGEMKYQMVFVKPFPGKADGYIKVAEEAGKTKVIWYYHQEMNFIMRGGFALMSGEKMLTKMFDRGLELLKNYSEAHAGDMPASAANMAIAEYQFPGGMYAGMRKTLTLDQFDPFYSESNKQLGAEAGARITGPSTLLIYSFDPEAMKGDFMVSFPISGTDPVKGAIVANVPASTAYKMVYTGPYSGFHAAHGAMMKHVYDAGKKPGLMLEEYIKHPANETDSNKYVTNIIYTVN